MPDIQLKPVPTDNFASLIMIVACFDDGRGAKPLATFLRNGLTEEEITKKTEAFVNSMDLNSPHLTGVRDVAVLTTLVGWNNPL